ncbi:hypothetical protein SDC9_168884 [bioreactor metagenome]|uniref:Uncharacterized protein n=1 Tax=bioreactor metagenome TaxID=1076179 RepID=A0A645GBT5_9ZZZZ
MNLPPHIHTKNEINAAIVEAFNHDTFNKEKYAITQTSKVTNIGINMDIIYFVECGKK